MQFIGPVGISGYAPWATWLEIIIVAGGAAAAVVIGAWLAKRNARKSLKSA
jgi:hypothetical protein